ASFRSLQRFAAYQRVGPFRRALGCTAGLFRHFDSRTGSLSQPAIDPHFIIFAEKNLQALIHIADSDALLEQACQLVLGNADAVVFHHDLQAALLQTAAHANGAAVDLARKPVADTVFDQWLQK